MSRTARLRLRSGAPTGRGSGRPRLRLLARLALALPGALAGCAAPSRPLLVPPEPPVVWPPPPDPPRIRYLGQLRGRADVAGAPAGGLGALLTGRPAGPAELARPTAVAVREDVVWVCDPAQHCVHRFDLARRTHTALRECGAERFSRPLDVWADDSGVYVLDADPPRVVRLDAEGHLHGVVRLPDARRPAALAREAQGGRLLVLDAGGHVLRVRDAQGRPAGHIGGPGTLPGRFSHPSGLTADPRLGIVVADTLNFRVQVLDAGGRVRLHFGRKGDGAGDFALPRDVAVDRDGHLYVLDRQFENVQIFDAQGRLLLAFGGEGDGPGGFSLPSGIWIDERDRIWIADTYNARVQVFAYLREPAP